MTANTTTAYHVLMPYRITAPDTGRVVGEGVADQVWDLEPGTTRQALYAQVIAEIRRVSGIPGSLALTQYSFSVGRNDLT